MLLRITVEATSVEALCTLATGYPWDEKTQDMRDSSTPPEVDLATTGEERCRQKEKHSRDRKYAGKKTCESCFDDVCVTVSVPVPLK